MDEIMLNYLGNYQSKDPCLYPAKCGENLEIRLKSLNTDFKSVEITDYIKNKKMYEIKNENVFKCYDFIEKHNHDTLCLCGMKIQNVWILENRENKVKIQIGSECVKKFDEQFKTDIFKICKKIEKEIKKYNESETKEIISEEIINYEAVSKDETPKIKTKNCVLCGAMIMPSYTMVKCRKCWVDTDPFLSSIFRKQESTT